MINAISLEDNYSSGVYKKRDLVITRGRGAYLWDEAGNRYLDCISGIGVANVGHCHPNIIQAIKAQAEELITCPELLYNDRRAALLELLAAKLPDGMDRLFLCNSGTESVEGAIKFARFSTGRPEIVATMRGFHGRTLGALSATHKPKYRDYFLPLVPEFTHVPFNRIEPMENAITENTAAVLVEVVQGEGGVRPGDREYFQALRRICDQTGALLILDEVQTGFGRTGRWFAFEHMDITPDIICLGKAIAGGIPMGAIGIGSRIKPLIVGIHGSTFGGNPLACAAAMATLETLEKEDLVSSAANRGTYLLDKLRNLTSPLIRDVRGLGLMIGMELRCRVHPILMGLMSRGVLALNAGPNTIRFLPPLVISEEDIDSLVAIVAEELYAYATNQVQQIE